MNTDKRKESETPRAKSHLYIGDFSRLTGFIGAVFVVGTAVIFVAGVPEARPFAVAAVVLGALLGFYLWLQHR
jgi:hypothetical protein